MIRTIDVSTELAAPAEAVWAAVKTPDAFRLVTRGLVVMPVIRGRTGPFRQGDHVAGVLLAFGVLPISRHRITVEVLDDDARLLRTDEAGGVLRSWRHDILVADLGGGRCRYRDRVRIDAGVLTPAAAAIARAFYRVRQRRWRQLAPVLSAAAAPASAC